MADIPGLIEGASGGKGLGHAFLRHIQRTRALVHCVSSEHENVEEVYQTIRGELSRYDEILLEKPEIIFLTKVDEITEEEIEEKVAVLQNYGTVVPVSILDDALLKNAQDAIVQLVGAQ